MHTRCDVSWSTSDRRARLPSDWDARRIVVRARADGQCEGITFDGEPRWHIGHCPGIGTDCDHDQAGDDHSLSNLRWLSSECHTEKTKRDSLAGMARRVAKLRHPSSRALPPGLR